MLSTTASSISNSNSIISDSTSSFRNSNNLNFNNDKMGRRNFKQQQQLNVDIKKQRRHGPKNGSIDSTSSYSTNGYLERNKRINEMNNSDLNQQKHRKQINRDINMNVNKNNNDNYYYHRNVSQDKNNNNNNNNSVGNQYFDNKKSNKLGRFAINDSSDISSNNLTLSELESNNSSRAFSSVRLQRKRLIKCILREDIDSLKTMLGKSDLLKIRDKHKNTLMHIACGFGRLKSVQSLFKFSPTLFDQVDDKGHSPIDIAIKHGQLDVVKWTLNKTNRLLMDSQPNKSYSNQRSCLHLAAKHGECEILRYILGEMYKQQLLLDIQDINGNTAAHLAAKYNHLDCLQALVEYNCDVTIVNKNSHTPCFVAEYYGNQECVHYLMIVETCINLSIKVVKLGRKLRETRNNNEILKAQMDEAIAINNDFINQRENVMNISLNLMQRQINELENKIFSEIKRLEDENNNLVERIDSLSKSKSNNYLNLFDNNNNRQTNRTNNNRTDIVLNQNNKLKNFKSLNSLNYIGNENDDRNYVLTKNTYLIYKKNTPQISLTNVENDLTACKQELINTNQNCHKILKLDQKRLESVKSRFDEIKSHMDASNDFDLFKPNTNNNNNSDNMSDIFSTKEHLDVLKKMYQDATHKLMIFRNALKERQLTKVKLTDVPQPNKSISQQQSSSSSTSSSPSLFNNSNTNNGNNRYTNNSSNNNNNNIRNNYQNMNRNLDEINEDEEYNYKEQAVQNLPPLPVKSSSSNENSNRIDELVSSTPKPARSTQSRLNQILTHEQSTEENKNLEEQNYDYSSDEDTLSDNDSRFADVPGEGDEDDDDLEEEDVDDLNEDIDQDQNENFKKENNIINNKIYENSNQANFYPKNNYFITEEDNEEEDDNDNENNLNVNDDIDVDEKFLINQEDEIDTVHAQNVLNNNNINNIMKNQIRQTEEKKMDNSNNMLPGHTVIQILNSNEDINQNYMKMNDNISTNRINNSNFNNNNKHTNLIYSNFISSNPNTNLNSNQNNNKAYNHQTNRQKSTNNYINLNSKKNNNNNHDNVIIHHQMKNEKVEIERRIEEFREEYEITNRQEQVSNKHRIYSVINNERVSNKYENNSIVK